MTILSFVVNCVQSNLFEVSAPCVVRLPSGEKQLMAEKFEHPEGLLYFDLYWHQSGPADAFHLLEGEIQVMSPGRSRIT